MNVFCCSRDWGFKGYASNISEICKRKSENIALYQLSYCSFLLAGPLIYLCIGLCNTTLFIFSENVLTLIHCNLTSKTFFCLQPFPSLNLASLLVPSVTKKYMEKNCQFFSWSGN